MNRIYLAIALALVIFPATSCKKEASKSNRAMFGTWELRKTSAAMMPGATNYPPGNGNLLKLNSDGSFEKFQNGILAQSGTFQVVEDPTVEQTICLVFPEGKFESRIIYSTDTTRRIFFDMADNRITFVEGCYAVDAGHQEEYEKVEGK